MIEIGDGVRQLRCTIGLLSTFLLLALSLPLTGCGGGDGGAHSTALPSANATSTPIPTPAPSPTPTAQPMVSRQEAESVVRSWFQDLAAGDYQKAESLTTGQAQQQTQQLVNTIHQQEQQHGVTLQFQITKLDLSPVSNGSVPQGGQAVEADFSADVVAKKGPLTVPARTVTGKATFVVEPTSNGPKISDIQNIQGLTQ